MNTSRAKEGRKENMLNNSDKLDYVLTVKDACKVLQLCPNSVYDLCRKGDLKAVQKKKKWLITRKAINDFLQNITK